MKIQLKKSTRLMFLVLVFALVAAACSSADDAGDGSGPDEGSESTATTAPTSEPSGGTIIFATNVEPEQLDPFVAINVNEKTVAAQIFETLVYLGQGFQLYPGLAESWEQSADAKTVTFKLREGVIFTNGDPLDAAAVKAHFDRLKSGEAGSSSSALEPKYVETRVIDSLTFELVFSEPFPDILIDLADPGNGITNAAAIAAAGAGAAEEPVGSGPFMLKEWVRGVQIVLEPNPDWTWGNEDFFGTSGPVKLDELVYRILGDASSRSAALSTGEIDFVDLVPYQDLESFEGAEGITIEGTALPGMPQMNYLNANIPPTDDIRVRRALIYAFDRDTLIETVYFNSVPPAYGPLSSDFVEYDPAVEDMYSYDPERAAALLDDAGWIMADDGRRYNEAGEPLVITMPFQSVWNHWVPLMQAQYQEAGFEVVLSEPGDYFSDTSATQYNVPAMGDVFASPVAIRRDLHSEALGPTSLNAGHLNDPVVDDLIDRASSEVDKTKRAELLSELQLYVMDQAYMVTVFELLFFTAQGPNVQGVVADGTGFYKYFAGASN